MRSIPLATATLALTVLPACASAEVLAQYSQGFQAPTIAPNVKATDLTPGPRLSGAEVMTLAKLGKAYYVSEPFFTATRTIATNKDPGTAYFSFTLTAAAGQDLDLTSFSFNANKGGGAGPRTIDVRSSVDDFATSITGGAIPINTQRPGSPPATSTTWTNIAVQLDGDAYHNRTSITFRVYLWTPDPGQSMDMDDLKVEGSVSPVR